MCAYIHMFIFLGGDSFCHIPVGIRDPNKVKNNYRNVYSNVSDTAILKINLFIYFWLHWVFVAVCGLSLVAARVLLIVVASLVAKHGL